ncbi:hypothetical protein CAPTEDRAFT_219021 [Capitella teleta]|uniref:NACHT domain-containing protein n=1 Tax=Capitella teleta TaxID=283909 RepID=R7TK19_CAPTE|nr:hypothetical protein CAPTEDRAFT_219021 [Capitella teleta]|eukprot:ELT91460.1 hypothetical protein CAPTEDRAFT_219021 [Capitella teleta]
MRVQLNLKPEKSLVPKTLLADDSDISPEQLEILLKGQACKFLFIADAYDEAHEGNQLLNRLIEGNLQRNATVLPLAKCAFESYLNDKCSLVESDLEACQCKAEDIRQTEYVVMETYIGPHSRAPRYSFSHRTLQKFLAALHLQKMAPEARLKWLKGATVALNETVLQFLFGMLQGENLLALARVVVGKVRFSSVDLIHSCAREHSLLRFICEIKNITPQLCDIIAINHPECIKITKYCIGSCIRTASIIVNIKNIQPESISFEFDFDSTLGFTSLMEEMAKSKCVRIVHLENCKSLIHLEDCLAALRVGLRDSSIQRVWIRSPQINASDVRQMSFGNHMTYMSLYECQNAQFTLGFIEAALNKPLQVLYIDDCEMDDECMERMPQLLNNPHLQYLSIANKNSRNIAQLLPRIADMDELFTLNISLVNMNEEEKRSFGRILQKNTLRMLLLRHCYFSIELCDALRRHFPSMSSLESLLIGKCDIGDHFAFGRTLSVAHHLQLKTLDMRDIKLSDENLKILCNVLPQLNNLINLRFKNVDLLLGGGTIRSLLSHQMTPFAHQMNFVRGTSRQHSPHAPQQQIMTHPNPHSARHLFGAIAQCRQLKKLTLQRMQIEDDLMSDLCEMLNSSDQLEELVISYNKLTVNSLQELSQCLKEPRKLKTLYLRGITEIGGKCCVWSATVASLRATAVVCLGMSACPENNEPMCLGGASSKAAQPAQTSHPQIVPMMTKMRSWLRWRSSGLTCQFISLLAIVTQPEGFIASHVIHWQTFLIELRLSARQFMPLAAERRQLSVGS